MHTFNLHSKPLWTVYISQSTTLWFSMLLVAHKQTPGQVHLFLAKPLGALFRGGDAGSCHGYLAAFPQAGGCGDVDYGYDAEI